MTDAELVQQILNGNSNAFRYLVSRHQLLVAHIIGRMIRCQEDLEDVSQEVFTKVYLKIHHFRGDSRLSTWIASIAYNTGISYLRKQRRFTELEEEALPESIKEPLTPGSILENDELKKVLLGMIEALPLKYRTVITLFYLEEFSYREMEKITGMPEGTIKSYLSRAKALLKNKISDFNTMENHQLFESYEELQTK